jgi:hypothetical protein
LEEDGAVAFGDAAFAPRSFDEAAGFDRARAPLFADRFVGRDDLRDVFADFDFDLLVAIWPSSGITTASCAATDTTPPIEAGREARDVSRYSLDR